MNAQSIVRATSCLGGRLTSVRQCSITYVDGIEVLSLYGTWEEMGRQYGELAAGHLRHVQDFLMDNIADDAAKRDSVINISRQLFSRYPYRLRQFFDGMEETSGLTMEQLIMNNAVEYSEGFFCSGIAAWGEYASGDLVYGRNYDAASYAPIARDIIITVFHPSDGALATATLGYAGVPSPTATIFFPFLQCRGVITSQSIKLLQHMLEHRQFKLSIGLEQVRIRD